MEIYILAFISIVIFGGGIYWLSQKLEKPSDDNLQKLNEEKERLFEEKTKLEAELNQKLEKVGELTQALKNLQTEKDNFGGANKQLIVENERIKGQNDSLSKEKNDLQKKISDFESRREHAEKEQRDLIIKLEHAKEKLEKEQARVIREDEDAQQKTLEEQNRIWNDHENLTIAKLREICQKQEIGFNFYDNTNLPTGFDGSLKPDFLVEFLETFIVFDAKCSKQKNPQTYINEQVKNTAKKYKNQPQVYSTIFFVVSQNEISNLKKYSFVEEGFSFFIISSEAIEPILANFRKIAEYDKIKDFDPQDRENIVNLVANYDRHISFRNAVDILLTKDSVKLMNSKEELPENFQEEISIRKKNMRPVKFKDSEVKNIAENLDQQNKEIDKLISPKIAVKQEELESANKLFEE